MEFHTALSGINSNSCPQCGSHLVYDVQEDSIYVTCNCGNFDVSTFRDKFDGSICLYYLNHADEGGVEENNLKELQNALYRNNQVKRELFTLKIQRQIM